MDAQWIVGRDQELSRLRDRLHQRKSLLIHGPAGVGKTLLLKYVLSGSPTFLYCERSPSAQAVFRQLATQLWKSDDPRLKTFCGSGGVNEIKSASAANVKGLVTEALRESCHTVVIDHISRPAPAFSASIRTVIGWCNTPIVAVARSAHMEDVGALHPLFPDRGDRFELKNFDPETARRFIDEVLSRNGPQADNLSEFRAKVLAYSQGNPGVIVSMINMAKMPKYSSNGRIKMAPLYIDFRLTWAATS